ncbi:MAG TPA: BREX-1 system phosphatase PglZ type B [Bacteroidia bacterium]|nr:BREX-1 system phosphatase PglZ type B [Bacteroidia bacterium]
MKYSIYDKVIKALKQAEQHNSSIMVKPEVILWPDPEKQWSEVIPIMQEDLPQLISYGKYNPDQKQGPSIWIKCMVARVLPEANWDEKATPIIYLPGVSKSDLRNVENARLEFQPLLEYQYTGTMFVQENGKEWTILAFMENPVQGLGLKVAKDDSTKNALKKGLPRIFRDAEIFEGKTIIDCDFLNNQLFPDIIHNILKWMCSGDNFLQGMQQDKREVFINICKTQYDFTPDYKNIFSIAEKLGTQRNQWKHVWQMYAIAPGKYPEIEGLLRSAKPEDMGAGVFAIPEESWPQVNEKYEDELRASLEKVAKLAPDKVLSKLKELNNQHQKRRSWVWSELGYSPLCCSLPLLVGMAEIILKSFPSQSVDEIKDYYITEGYNADQYMRKALASVKSDKDKRVIKSIIRLLYAPWLELITKKFQALIQKDPSVFTNKTALPEPESYVLFVDAFRFELAKEFEECLIKIGYKTNLTSAWSAIPTVTPTAKPDVSPIATDVLLSSEFTEFRPQLKKGKDLQNNTFKEAIESVGYSCVKSADTINSDEKYWQEIGDIDKKGHDEQSGIVKRIEELFDYVREIIDSAFEKGVKRIKIVTDHGWLLMPGGLPKTQLHDGLTETRWGRCALIKEGVKSELLQLPWRWNPSVFIAYAPGISFFKANEEYAHGGISVQECLLPVLIVENVIETGLAPKIINAKWVGLKCAVETENSGKDYTIDIRTKFNDEKTTIVISKNKAVIEDKGSLMVNDEAESQSATIVLLDDKGRIRDKKVTTVGE